LACSARRLRRAHGVRRLGSRGDVGEGDDDAFDAIVLGAVRQDAADIPGPAERFDLSLDRRQGSQDGIRVRQQRFVGGQRLEIRERPADVARNDIEQRARGGVKKRMLRLESRKMVATSVLLKHVLQVVGGGSLLLQRLLKLAVQRRQLFVQRLQLLLRGQQFLVGRLKLLLDG